MKVYIVITERDGETRKEPGNKTVTEIEKQQYRYAAESIDEVWDAIARLRNDPDEEVVTIHEEHPAIIILGGTL